MKVLYIFSSGRTERLSGGTPFPDELFFGYTRPFAGIRKSVIQENDLRISSQNPLWEKVRSFLLARTWVDLALLLPARQRLDFFTQFDLIFLTTNIQIATFSLLRKMGYIKGSLCGIPMGFITPEDRKLKQRLSLHLLKEVSLFPIGKPEEAFLKRLLGKRTRVQYVPFGADSNFWQPAPKSSEAFVLALGNDVHRDYDLLIKAWEPAFPTLLLLSGRNLDVTGKNNIRLLHGDWRKQAFPDKHIRQLYQQASFVIVPQKHAIYTAGQSVSVQAMACGKAVIISNIQGMWDSEKMIDRENCLLVQPENLEELSCSIRFLINHPLCKREIGIKARKTIEESFSSHLTAECLHQEFLRCL